jgi:hypothetical protein
MKPHDTGVFLSDDMADNDLCRLIETRDNARTTA